MIIGITGHMRAGKDEVARTLVQDFGFVRYGFGDILKAEVKDRFNRTLRAACRMDVGADVYEGTAEPHRTALLDEWFGAKPLIVRALLQEYGTEVRRADDENYWVRRWMRGREQAGTRVVTPDVRFLNEASAIRNLNGLIVRVVRPSLANTSTHVSETEMDQIEADLMIYNDGTRDDLAITVHTVLGPFVRMKQEATHGA